MSRKVELIGLVKRYGRSAAVDDVTLEIGEGELVALLGPSGCGKTTTLRIVAGFVEPTSGVVRIGGREVTRLPPHRRDTGMVFQSYALFPHLTVAENIAFGLKRRRLGREEIGKRVAETVAALKLDGLENRLPRQLSGGQQQRVAVGRALVINPTVLLLDEPFSNLDAQLRESTRVELRRLQQSLGITTIFVTHDQSEAMAIADRIAVMNAGRIEQVASPEAVYHRPASRFVATFIGRANLFEARRVGERLVTEDGIALAPPAAPKGDHALLAVRPEAIRLAPPTDQEKPNAARCRVELVSFLGATTHLEVVHPKGRRLLVELPGRTALPFSVGAEVTAEWNADSVTVCES